MRNLPVLNLEQRTDTVCRFEHRAKQMYGSELLRCGVTGYSCNVSDGTARSPLHCPDYGTGVEAERARILSRPVIQTEGYIR